MILAMGIGSWVGGLFHLITHAFFKALLFLGFGQRDPRRPPRAGTAAVRRAVAKIPVTAITFAIAVLAIAGSTPFVSPASTARTLILAHAGAFAAGDAAGTIKLVLAVLHRPDRASPTSPRST